MPEKPITAEMTHEMMPSAIKINVPTINGVGMPMVVAFVCAGFPAPHEQARQTGRFTRSCYVAATVGIHAVTAFQGCRFYAGDITVIYVSRSTSDGADVVQD